MWENCQRLGSPHSAPAYTQSRQQQIRARANVVGQKIVIANVYLVEIDSPNQLVRAISHVANFQHRLESDLALDAKVVLLNARQLQVRINEKRHIRAGR